MTDRQRSSGLERRAFLGVTAAGAASVLAPRGALAQATAESTPAAGVKALTAERLVGSAVNYAYAVKAGPLVFLNGHEGYDFAAGAVPAVEGAAGFPEYGKPRLRREADFIFERMGQTLKSLGTDFAHSVRLDQYYSEANAVRAYHLARFAALGKYVPPSTSILTERCFGARSNMATSLVAVLPDPGRSKASIPRAPASLRSPATRPPWWRTISCLPPVPGPTTRTCSIPIRRRGRIAAGAPSCRSDARRNPP
jgi:hypothetical protein